MMASAGPYPSFVESIPRQGVFAQCLLLILVAAFLFGGFRLWRTPALTFPAVLLMATPLLIGCLLAAFQSFHAQTIVEMKEAGSGMVYIGRPDRYIGHIRIYLLIGIVMSLFLFGLAFLSSRRQPSPE